MTSVTQERDYCDCNIGRRGTTVTSVTQERDYCDVCNMGRRGTTVTVT